MVTNGVDLEFTFARAGASLGDAEFASNCAGADEDRKAELGLRVNAELDRMFAIYRLAGHSCDDLTRAGLSVVFVRAALERLGERIGQLEQRA
ncbi:MAG TPA: hypothetical protein VMU18_00890 [Rhodoblastus sp.]|nr:hypothetical protein [Rhodoblastus sp.]